MQSAECRTLQALAPELCNSASDFFSESLRDVQVHVDANLPYEAAAFDTSIRLSRSFFLNPIERQSIILLHELAHVIQFTTRGVPTADEVQLEQEAALAVASWCAGL